MKVDKSKDGSAVENEVVSNDDEGEENQNGSVSLDSHKRLLAQRKADRARVRELEAERATMQAEREQAEADRLAEQNKYKELYEKEVKAKKDLESKLSDMTTSQITKEKKLALDKALGGIKKSEYLGFADLASVQMNDDGTVDMESVATAANKFRESYPELVPTKQTGRIDTGAPRDAAPKQPRKLSELSVKEMAKLLREKTQAEKAAK